MPALKDIPILRFYFRPFKISFPQIDKLSLREKAIQFVLGFVRGVVTVEFFLLAAVFRHARLVVMAGDEAAKETESLYLVGDLYGYPVRLVIFCQGGVRNARAGTCPLESQINVFRIIGYLQCNLAETLRTRDRLRFKRLP